MQVGVRFVPAADGAAIPASTTCMPFLEASYSVDVGVVGPGAFDVRDSANAWLRVTLPARCAVVR